MNNQHTPTSSKILATLRGWYESALADKWKLFQVCAILVLAAATFYAIDSNQDDTRTQTAETLSNQRAGCLRTNDLRRQINQRSEDLFALTAATNKLFIRIAAAPNVSDGLRTDLKMTTDQYKRITSTYTPLPTINCAKAYPGVNDAARSNGENVEEK